MGENMSELNKPEPKPLANDTQADAEALRALATWTNSGSPLSRTVGISESYTRDRPFWRVTICEEKAERHAEHSDLAAAIMDSLGKANANRAA